MGCGGICQSIKIIAALKGGDHAPAAMLIGKTGNSQAYFAKIISADQQRGEGIIFMGIKTGTDNYQSGEKSCRAGKMRCSRASISFSPSEPGSSGVLRILS